MGCAVQCSFNAIVQVRLIPLSSVDGAAPLAAAAAGAAAPPAVAAAAGEEELVVMFVFFSTLISVSFMAIAFSFFSPVVSGRFRREGGGMEGWLVGRKEVPFLVGRSSSVGGGRKSAQERSGKRECETKPETD